MPHFREEKDSMGPMKIEDKYLYGASTQRAVNNFPVSNLRFPRVFNEALGLIKQAAAETNLSLGKLSVKLAKPISAAAAAVAKGQYDEHLIVDIFQTGSGTSTNMNINEVIANIVNKKMGQSLGSKDPVHPNDHVNMGQSSNDVIPSAIHLSALILIDRKLLPHLKVLQQDFKRKSIAFKKIIKTGRTHLQDATPVTLGQEFSGFARQIELGITRVKRSIPNLSELAIGGTAVGTGINTHKHFAKKTCAKVSLLAGVKVVEAKNHFEAQGAKDACVEMSGVLKTLAVSLLKIANDIRWLACGPRTGFYEIIIPEVQPGSSIMPGKVNPVIPESVTQVAAQVIGNDTTISIAGASGNFELNVMMPVLAYNLLQSIELLSNVVDMFSKKCIQGLKANKKQCDKMIEKSLALCTSLVPEIGYDQSAELAKEAFKTGKTIRELLRKKGLIDEKKIDSVLDPGKMV